MPIEFDKTTGQRRGAEAKMRVTMLVDWTTAAVDGTHTVTYRAGETYDVPERVAGPWIEKGRAVKFGQPVPEVKMEPAAPENKMEPGPVQSKAIRARVKRIGK